MATYDETMSGGVLASGNALANLTIDKSFTWNVGELPLRWWRLEGCCSVLTPSSGSGSTRITGGCDLLGIQVDSNCNRFQQLIQNVLARNLSEVCSQLEASGIKWKLCSVKSFSKTADNNDPDECNILTEVPFEQIPECMQFALHTDAIVNMKSGSVAIQNIYDYDGLGVVELYGEGGFGFTLNDPLEFSNEFSEDFSSSSFSFVANSFSYSPNEGEIVFSGEAETDTSWKTLFITNMISSSLVEREEAVFDVDTNISPLILPNQFVSTSCGLCVSVPVVLYVNHNLNRAGILAEFLQRNGLELPSSLTLHYSTRQQSWISNYHLLGEDNESWRFVFSWNCASEIAGDDLGDSAWNFSLLIVRKNLDTNLDFDTRIIVVFNPSNICSGVQNLGFDFSFSLDTTTSYVTDNLNVVASSVVLYDNIGMFKTNAWIKNPSLNINISKNETVVTSQRKDIYSLFPTRKVELVS